MAHDFPLTRARSGIDPRGSSFWYQVGFLMLALSLVIRALWYPVIVSDYTYFGKPWFDTLASNPGLTAFAHPFADYAPAYLYLIKGLTFVPVSSLTSEKTLSLAFDALVAVLGYSMLRKSSRWSLRSDVLFVAAVTLFSLPTVMMNSSLWGQTDALYSAGVIASLLFILSDTPLWAAIAFGVALCFKLQAIFFAPVLIGYLLRKRETWWYLILPPMVYVLSVVPAWLSGGSLSYWLTIYMTQAKEYPYLSVSAQSVFAFLQPLPLSPFVASTAFWLGMIVSALIAVGAGFIVYKRRGTTMVVLASLASALLLPYFLPRMHERYFYLADLVAVLYAFYQPKRWFIPVIVVGTSLASYMPFLSKQVSFLSWARVDLRLPALLLLIPICAVLFDVWRAGQHDGHAPPLRPCAAM